MTKYNPMPLRFKPGIQRDGTRLSAPQNWIDGLWTRFHNMRPRKMGGIKQLTADADGIQRSFENYFSNGTHYLHMGSVSSLRQMTITAAGVAASPAVRTPSALTMSGDELWQLDSIYDPIIGNAATLIAHAGRNLNDISSSVETPLYYGASTATTALAALSGLVSVSGGCCVVGPYLTFYGNSGYFGWGGPNKINDMTVASGGGATNYGAQKICAGFSTLGGNGPSGLYWSLDSLIRTSFIGGTATWAFDTVSDKVSIMSSRCMNTIDGYRFEWMGLNNFFIYDGSTIQVLPNPTNSDWLFKNINRTYRQKCFTWVNKRWGEIWYCFPFGSATECTHAVIHNVDENTWYDTRLLLSGLGGAMAGDLFNYPIAGGVDLTSGQSRVWQMETGTDIDYVSSTTPIQAYIESSDVSMLSSDKPTDATLSCIGVEPDITQTGNMTLTITGNANARASAKDAESITFTDAATSEDDQILRPKAERRQMRFRWESNTTGGDFELGTSLAHIGQGSSRQTG